MLGLLTIHIKIMIKGEEECLGGDGYNYCLTVVMVSWVYTYSQTHRGMYLKYVPLFTCQSYLNKVA